MVVVIAEDWWICCPTAVSPSVAPARWTQIWPPALAAGMPRIGSCRLSGWEEVSVREQAVGSPNRHRRCRRCLHQIDLVRSVRPPAPGLLFAGRAIPSAADQTVERSPRDRSNRRLDQRTISVAVGLPPTQTERALPVAPLDQGATKEGRAGLFRCSMPSELAICDCHPRYRHPSRQREACVVWSCIVTWCW